MLILDRDLDNSIIVIHQRGLIIGKLKLVNVRGHKVRIAFDFPREIEIDRLEKFEQHHPTKKEEKKHGQENRKT